jgi:hypothetical protein
MTIVVEDGTLVTGANSYVTRDDAWDYAKARGVDLPACEDEIDAIIYKAMDYLESFSARFKGDRVDRDQALSWPRSGVVIESWPWTSEEIPRQVINAQLALIMEINAGVDPLNPTPSTLPVIGEKIVGAVEVQYANPGKALKVSKTQPSRTLINLLLRNSGLFAVRV